MRTIVSVATTAIMLGGCSGGQGGPPSGAMPEVQERSYRVKDQSQEVVYVPVLRFEKAEWKSRMEDTLTAALTIDACKNALAQRAKLPLTGQFAGYKITEHVCYEVTKSGTQKKIVVGNG